MDSATGLDFTAVYRKADEVILVLNVREKLSTLTDGSAVAHLGQYGTGVHMKITDEMVPCPVCGWMRDHTSPS